MDSSGLQMALRLSDVLSKKLIPIALSVCPSEQGGGLQNLHLTTPEWRGRVRGGVMIFPPSKEQGAWEATAESERGASHQLPGRQLTPPVGHRVVGRYGCND
jgi:hypothetical protein